MMCVICGCPPGEWRWRLGGQDIGGAPTTDRLIAAYPDLISRHFQTLFDFEDPDQAALFHKHSGDTIEPLSTSAERARSETGVAALKVGLADGRDQIVAADNPDNRWPLLRDWSHYHLLLVNVYSPRELPGFGISIRSGVEEPLVYRHTPLALKTGWNLVRIDLALVGERLDLRDVREMRFACPQLDAPVDLFFDDVILADNRTRLYGQDSPEPGGLYAQAAGQRLFVGAADRFELVFDGGLLVGWYDLGRDTTRTRNLAGDGPLGPQPLMLGGGPGIPSTADCQQQISEASNVRIVLEGGCQPTPSNASQSTDLNELRWRYTVYPDGRAYVVCTGTLQSSGADTSAWGMRFGCDREANFADRIATSRPGEENSADYALFSRVGRGLADLLIVPSSSLPPQATPSTNAHQLTVAWQLPAADRGLNFAAMLRVWPPDIDSPEQALPLAADYAHPLPIQVDIGTLLPTEEGDLDNDGFIEAEGCYALQLDGSLARVRLDGRRVLRFSPIFKVVDTSARNVWIYRDGRQIRKTCRDKQGNVVFVVEGAITSEVLIEVHSAPKSAILTGP